jgi:murein DD-endopeptidase MepM/ murein hydrolase activator NlpD
MVRDGGTKPHQGNDYSAPLLSPVFSADKGRVVLQGKSGTWGNYVVIGHQNTDGKTVSYTAYMHLTSSAVANGQEVQPGEWIGVSGDTGNAKGEPPHLHFEIWTSLDAAKKGSGLKDRVNPEPGTQPVTE